MKKAPEYAIYYYECCEGTWPGSHTIGCRNYVLDPKDVEIIALKARVEKLETGIEKIIEDFGTEIGQPLWAGEKYLLCRLCCLLPSTEGE